MAEEDDKTYKYDELSKEAQEQAIREWRESEHSWGQLDSDDLSEFFKEELINKGFDDDVKVYWSLGYCQGDGVCFEGRVDVNMLSKEAWFKPYKDLIPYIGIKVTNPSHQMCHYNSMHVEVNLDEPAVSDLISKKTWEEMQVRQVENERLRREYERAYYKIKEERIAPIRQWQEREWKGPEDVLDWMPGPEPKPEELNIPYPEEPTYRPELARHQKAREKAEAAVKRLGDLSNKLEEDLKEWVEDISHGLEKAGYSEMEYKSSEEYISEIFRANDYDFTEEGEIQW